MKHIETLDRIASDTFNWSKQVREACKAGAEALRQQEKLNKLLKAWETIDDKR